MVWSQGWKERGDDETDFTLHDQVSMQNTVESKNLKFELKLPSCYEHIFAKVGGYFI